MTSPWHHHLQAGQLVFTAGQIGLEPATMTLASPSLQPSLSLTHLHSVLEANYSHLSSALCGVCYYTTEEAGWAARSSWTQVSSHHVTSGALAPPGQLSLCHTTSGALTPPGSRSALLMSPDIRWSRSVISPGLRLSCLLTRLLCDVN